MSKSEPFQPVRPLPLPGIPAQQTESHSLTQHYACNISKLQYQMALQYWPRLQHHLYFWAAIAVQVDYAVLLLCSADTVPGLRVQASFPLGNKPSPDLQQSLPLESSRCAPLQVYKLGDAHCR